MKGTYEHSWQEAMAGATMEPSEAIWENIASNLDSERGHNYWVTLLMIAATVTMAFALPLTMGNLDYQARPDQYYQITQSTETQPKEKVADNKMNAGNELSGNTATTNKAQSSNSTQNPISNYQFINNQSAITSRATNKEQLAEDNSKVLTSETSNLAIASTRKNIDFSYLNEGSSLSEIKSYYMVPYFMPVKKDDFSNTNLLASLNMGTGSVSNTTGSSKIEALFAQNDQSPDVSGFKNNVSRSEESGTTYYLGGGVEFPLGKKWSLLTGIGYRAQHAQGTTNIVLENGTNYQPLGAYAPITSGTAFLSETYSYSATNSYLSVPVAFKYPFIQKRVMLRAGLGISSDLMLSYRITSEAYGSASYSPKSQEYKTFLLGGIATIDISYNLNKQYAIAFETGYRRGLTSMDENKEYYPSSFTVGIILFYKIK